MPELIMLLALAIGVGLVYLILKGRAEWDVFESNESDEKLRKMLNRGRL